MALQQIATRVTEEEKQALERFCEKHDLSISQLLRRALKEYLRNHAPQRN